MPDPVETAYHKRDFETMFRELNGLWMIHLLDSLVRLERLGYHPSRNIQLRNMGIDYNRMYIAMAAVRFRGKMKPGRFYRHMDVAQYSQSIPQDQREEISGFLVQSLPRVAVFAAGPWVMGQRKICEDARLRSRDGSVLIAGTGDRIHGQAGWDIGMNVNHLEDLATKLNSLHGKVRRLGIVAHGGPGEFHIAKPPLIITQNENDIRKWYKHLKKDNKKLPIDTFVRDGRVLDTVSEHKEALISIARSLTPDATVLLLGCRAGEGLSGRKLVMRISEFLQGRRIVAFTTIQYHPGDNKLTVRGIKGRGLGEGACLEPGVRNSPYTDSPGSPEEEFERYHGPNQKKWNDLGQLPWGSEDSGATIKARNGKILGQFLGMLDDIK